MIFPGFTSVAIDSILVDPDGQKALHGRPPFTERFAFFALPFGDGILFNGAAAGAGAPAAENATPERYQPPKTMLQWGRGNL